MNDGPTTFVVEFALPTSVSRGEVIWLLSSIICQNLISRISFFIIFVKGGIDGSDSCLTGKGLCFVSSLFIALHILINDFLKGILHRC